jgi:hypothetical protein
VRIPTSSRPPETDGSEPTTTPIKARRDEDEPTLHDLPPAPAAPGAVPSRAPGAEAPRTEAPRIGDLHGTQRPAAVPPPVPVPSGPRPRASLLATLGLICGVAGALLVLSGQLLGWGLGVAGLGLLLSLFGIRATRKRHVAGKTDALLGILLSLAAIVLGVLALTGALSWLTTGTPVVSNVREWLDAQFGKRF